MKKINIAVDGTAGSGKTFIFDKVAKKIGYELIDTGLLYRSFTYYCFAKKIDFNNQEEIKKAAETFTISFNDKKIFIDEGKIEVTDKLLSKEVTDNINKVTILPEVRDKMFVIERQLGNKPGVIELGRDITTVVLPDADLKIYFDSPLEVRAQRRYEQNKRNGVNETYEEVYTKIKNRDDTDKNREFGALKISDEAWYIDSSKYETPEQLVDVIVEKIKTMEEK